MVGWFPPVPVDSFERSFGGLLTGTVTVAVTVASGCAVTPPTSLFAKKNTPITKTNAPISSAANLAATWVRDPKRLLSAGF